MPKESLAPGLSRRVWLRFLILPVVACAASLLVKADPPVLLSQANSTRAVALESVSLTRESFGPDVSSLLSLGPDTRTRVTLFALNLDGATVSNLSADAEDESHRHHDFKVEYVGLVPGAGPPALYQVIVRLSDDIDAVGDVLLQLKYAGALSNRVRVGIGYVGGGPADDVIRLGGRVTGGGGVGLPGVIVTLGGAQSGLTVTDSDGNYAFSNLNLLGSYTVTASKNGYTFTPQSRSLPSLVGSPTADFSASRVNFTISGQVTNGGKGLSGVPVTLNGAQAATTDANGNYSISAPSEGNYLVAPTPGLFTFSPSGVAFNNLGGNQTANFATATRAAYSISGHVRKGDGSPLADATVVLTGPQPATVLTDATGFYAFANLGSGGDYAVAVSKMGYTISPPTQSFAGLDRNQTFDATATPLVYSISGRVTDGYGAGVPGILVTLTGSQSAAVQTDMTGRYSFNVNVGGNYVVTPSSPLNSFSPAAAAFDNLSDTRTVNFSALDLNGYYVLEFDGSQQTVDYGDFFELKPGQTQLGKFFWEAWAMPGSNAFARYLISDGYGGAHALLFGFSDGGGGRYSLYGNVWNGTTAVQFSGDDGPAPGEWAHVAVGWDGNQIITYYDGVPVGLTNFAGPRLPAGGDNGGGRLFIGGSDHSNFMGRIAQVRGFEGVNPRDNGLQRVSFRPDLFFGLNMALTTGPGASFLTSFLRPAFTVPDLAGGRTGVLRGTGFTAPNPMTSYPLPQFVKDPTAPTASTGAPPTVPDGMIDTPAAVPNGALIFDSFSRKNSTYAFMAHGGLGSTEGGSGGSKKWLAALVPGGGTNEINSPFGILNGRAVPLSDFDPGYLAWVDAGTSSYYVSAVRNPGFWHTGIDTAVSFRVADSANFFFAYTFGATADPAQRKLFIGYWQDGRQNFLATNIAMPSTWTRLKVATISNGTIVVFADGTELYRDSSSILAGASGAGLYFQGSTLAPFYRWDDFTVSSAP